MKDLLKRRETSLFVIIAIVVAAVTFRTHDFFTPGNFAFIFKDSSILLVVSIGQLLVILTGGIDLSVASIMGFTGMSVALLDKAHPDTPLAVIILVAMAIGFVLGSFNGLLVSGLNIPPIIATLGTLSIYRGFVIVLSGGTWVSADQMTASFRNFPQASFFGISNMISIALLVFVIFAVFLHLTRSGRDIYGVGGNPLAAQYVGIDVKKTNFRVFALSGILSGLAGYLWVAFYASAANDSASGLELQTVAACVVGGVNIMGGSGTIAGVLLGSVFLGIVKNALTMIRISPFWQVAIQGFVILLAIIVNTVLDRRAQASMLKRRVL
ncbi:MAG TPA: ABC transporter permease [Rectinemataceae bacterium]|nr:ABC transporter permease [Rectinemataceae bacterium]